MRANHNAPIFTLSHTMGVKDLWSDYTYNNTELGIYKRWWVKSWGKLETHVKAGAQWNRVPFPLLLMPWANTSYVKEDAMFNLVKNMEFMKRPLCLGHGFVGLEWQDIQPHSAPQATQMA